MACDQELFGTVVGYQIAHGAVAAFKYSRTHLHRTNLERCANKLMWSFSCKTKLSRWLLPYIRLPCRSSLMVHHLLPPLIVQFPSSLVCRFHSPILLSLLARTTALTNQDNIFEGLIRIKLSSIFCSVLGKGLGGRKRCIDAYFNRSSRAASAVRLQNPGVCFSHPMHTPTETELLEVNLTVKESLRHPSISS